MKLRLVLIVVHLDTDVMNVLKDKTLHQHYPVTFVEAWDIFLVIVHSVTTLNLQINPMNVIAS